MIIKARNLYEKEIIISDVSKFEFVRSADAPCDSFYAEFQSDFDLGEIDEICVFDGGTKVFCGTADCQTMQKNASGLFFTLYARSAAAVLVDNEAAPCIYNMPCSQGLFNAHAREFGFVNKTENIYSNESYEIQKGTSCWGAINNFVYSKTLRNIYVNQNKEIVVLRPGENVENLDSYNVLSAKKVINRGSVISEVHYKINGSDKYCYCLKSTFAEERNICRKRFVNLSGIPAYRRENSLHKKIGQGLEDYYCGEVVLNGAVNFDLLARVKCVALDSGEYLIRQIVISGSESGIKTKLSLSREFDAKEINYVDE